MIAIPDFEESVCTEPVSIDVHTHDIIGVRWFPFFFAVFVADLPVPLQADSVTGFMRGHS